jgi:diguanylate cyclase (GGDEF)-like protein
MTSPISFLLSNREQIVGYGSQAFGLYSGFSNLNDASKSNNGYPLSGALNRRGVMEFANKAFAEQEEKGIFSAVVIDIDRFKDINDNYGHAAGDAVIARVVEIARRIAGGKSCAVGRLGGDELVVLIVGQSLEETMTTAERLRQAIEHTVFMHEDRRLMATTSIGVAAADPADQSAEAVLRRADQSLYAAKSAGRNRVRSAA